VHSILDFERLPSSSFLSDKCSVVGSHWLSMEKSFRSEGVRAWRLVVTKARRIVLAGTAEPLSWASDNRAEALNFQLIDVPRIKELAGNPAI